MAVTERWVDPSEAWPPADELAELAAGADLLLLPDRVDTKPDGTTIASFREEAQAFRVNAMREGIAVEMVRPEGSTLAAYREHAAEWILPALLAGPIPIVINLISNHIQRWIDDRAEGDRMPNLRYREAHLESGSVRVRELEGPADEVLKVLQGERAALEQTGPHPRDPEAPES